MRRRPAFRLLGAFAAVVCMAPLSCTPTEHQPADAPAEDANDRDGVVEDGREADVADDTGATLDDAGDAECTSYCGTPCEGADAACGERCCVGHMVYDPEYPGCSPCEMTCAPLCALGLHLEGLVVVDYSLRPELRTDPRLPRLAEYEYRGDGTELVVGAAFTDQWRSYACLDHCYANAEYVWVIDVPTWETVYFEQGPQNWLESIDFNLLDDFAACPSPLPGDDSIVPCIYRADVPELDETFYLGWKRSHFIKGWDHSGEWVDHTAELPDVADVVPVHRISTGEYLGSVDLRLDDPETR